MKKLGKFFRGILIVCGVLFIILLLLPDDEEPAAPQGQMVGVQTATEPQSRPLPRKW